MPSFAASAVTPQPRFMVGIRVALTVMSFGFLVGEAHADPVAAAARVHISSPVPVSLERRATPSSSWQQVCLAPCDRNLPFDGDYRPVFETGDPGEIFHLDPAAGYVIELTIEQKSKPKKIAGIVMMSIGAPVAVGGFVGAASAVALAASSHSDYAGLGYAVGLVCGLIGLAGTGVFFGGLRLASNADAHATQDPIPPPHAAVLPTKPGLFVPLTFAF